LVSGRCVAANFGDHRADRGAVAFLDEDLAQFARGIGLHLDVGLIAFDLDEGLAFYDLLAFLFQPVKDLAALHGVGQPRHLHVCHFVFS